MFKIYKFISVICLLVLSIASYAQDDDDPCANLAGTWYGSKIILILDLLHN